MTAVAKDPVAVGKFGYIEGATQINYTEGIWTFDDDDWALYVQLCDPIYMSELLFTDPNNDEYGGAYHVEWHQYPLFRPTANEEGFPCARSVGKTESLKARAVCHIFKRTREDMLITAPEMIHLDPLVKAIEERLRTTRLTSDFLDMRNGKTGFTHKPFEAAFLDGTKIVGRIPNLDGRGVKGMHVPDLLMDEGQDYPKAGWREVFPTVKRDHVNPMGEPDFVHHFYGVHIGAGDNEFYRLSSSGKWKITQITAVMKPTWSKSEKDANIAMYAGSHTSDYRRNVLGEAGGSASAFFVLARLMTTIDQDQESEYNTQTYQAVKLEAPLIDDIVGPISDKGAYWEAMYDVIGQQMRLPDIEGPVYAGMDFGMVQDPTVITLWTTTVDKNKKPRLQIIRRYTCFEFRERMIRQAAYQIGWKYGKKLRGFGMDMTGLGLPLFQAMEDDEFAPQHLVDVSRGFVFNAKIAVGVDESMIQRDTTGRMHAFGSIVELEKDEFTGTERYVVKMSMIEASTRYLREWVDSGYLMIPFDNEIIGDMKAETESRVRAIANMGGRAKKANAFHILDSMRAMAMVYKARDIDAALAVDEAEPVMSRALDLKGELAAMGTSGALGGRR